MWQNYSAAFALTFASVIAISPIVKAESASIPFSGNVEHQATFTNPDIGAITPTTPGVNASAFESTTPVQMSVQLNMPANITVSPPVLTSGPSPDPSGTNYIGFLTFNGTNLRSDVGGGSGSLPAGTTNLDVNMSVQRPTPYPPGTYTYVVTLTISP